MKTHESVIRRIFKNTRFDKCTCSDCRRVRQLLREAFEAGVKYEKGKARSKR